MKAAIYCRLSEEDRNKQFETDDSNSIQNQKAMLIQYTVEQGGSYTTFTATMITRGLTVSVRNLTDCLPTQKSASLILFSAKRSRVLHANWSL